MHALDNLNCVPIKKLPKLNLEGRLTFHIKMLFHSHVLVYLSTQFPLLFKYIDFILRRFCWYSIKRMKQNVIRNNKNNEYEMHSGFVYKIKQKKLT